MGIVYDPKTSKAAKVEVRRQLLQHREIPKKPIEGGMKVEITFYLQRPKTLSKKVVYHTKKPDMDNLEKLCWDAMEGIIFKNDSQIFETHVIKMYATELNPPGVLINVFCNKED